MTEDEMRAALMRVVLAGMIRQWPAGDITDALLPTVRRIVAEELRAAAEWLNADPDEGGAPYIARDNSVLFPDTLEVARIVSWAAASLHDRADALDPT